MDSVHADPAATAFITCTASHLRTAAGVRRALTPADGSVGTSVAFLTVIYGKAGKEDDAKGYKRKRGSCMSLALRDTAHIPDNNENDTPPHTSKRPTPRASGVFFGRLPRKYARADATP